MAPEVPGGASWIERSQDDMGGSVPTQVRSKAGDMNAGQRFKLSAGAGLVTMLLGALMVLAPGGAGAVVVAPDDPRLANGGNLECEDLDALYTATAKNEAGTTSGSISGSGFLVDFELLLNGDGDEDNVMQVTVSEGSRPVYAVIVKTGNATNTRSNGLTAYEEFEPALIGGQTGTVGYPADAVSNIKVCGRTPSLTVTKKVVNSSEEFEITVTPEGGDPVADDLGDDESIEIDDASGDYTIVETLPEGWQEPVIACGNATTATPEGGDFTVSVEDDDVACTVTNTPEQEPDGPELTVRKAVTGSNAPASWSFDFEICEVAVGETEETCSPFTLDNDPQTESGIEKVFPAGLYDITELDDGNLTSIVCTDENGSVDGSTVFGVDVADSDVVCVFTNNFPGGGGSSLTYSVELEKLADSDDADDEFTDDEDAVADGSDVDFQLTISNTGTGPLSVESLVDVFESADGEDVEVDLLAPGVLVCERDGQPASIGDDLPGESTTVCTFTLEGYARAGEVITNTVTLETDRAATVEDDASVNTPEVASEATGTVTLVKQVRGADDVEDWAFEFDGALGDVTLTDDLTSTTPQPLASGQYTIAEDTNLPEGWEFDDASCVDSSGATVSEPAVEGAVEFTVAPDAAVTCTFVNEYTAPEAQPTAEPTPAVEVKGDVVTRPATLPRTGDETRGLAGVGAMLLALGAAMVLGSKRSLARG